MNVIYVKFSHINDVVVKVIPGMKALSALNIGGLNLMPERYRRLEQLIKDPEYDTFGYEEQVDRDFLSDTMKNYLHTDPATRMQIARNYFERAVHSAKVCIPTFD